MIPYRFELCWYLYLFVPVSVCPGVYDEEVQTWSVWRDTNVLLKFPGRNYLEIHVAFRLKVHSAILQLG